LIESSRRNECISAIGLPELIAMRPTSPDRIRDGPDHDGHQRPLVRHYILPGGIIPGVRVR
jgi:hypothetical protein